LTGVVVVQSLVYISGQTYIAWRARNLWRHDGPSVHDGGQSGSEMREETMLTRRNFLAGVISIRALTRGRHSFEKASQPATLVNFDIPPHSCDCHTHIYGDPNEFPHPSPRLYTPEATPPEEMSALHRALHMERVVIVTPSVYSTDNSATLYHMKARGTTARGVAIIDDKTPNSDLDAMNRTGVRGIRIISGPGGPVDPAAARRRFQSEPRA
jgi:hypothetical protein